MTMYFPYPLHGHPPLPAGVPTTIWAWDTVYGDWRCQLCRKFATPEHLKTDKHLRRVPEWRYWLRNFDDYARSEGYAGAGGTEPRHGAGHGGAEPLYGAGGGAALPQTQWTGSASSAQDAPPPPPPPLPAWHAAAGWNSGPPPPPPPPATLLQDLLGRLEESTGNNHYDVYAGIIPMDNLLRMRQDSGTMTAEGDAPASGADSATPARVFAPFDGACPDHHDRQHRPIDAQ